MADALLSDPLGRPITLHDHTWYGHILKRRAELRTLRRGVEATVQAPNEIRLSTSGPHARVYYSRPNAAGIMIAVVADVVAGHVLTAYRTNRPKGVIEWP